jgi:hypothetical protein
MIAVRDHHPVVTVCTPGNPISSSRTSSCIDAGRRPTHRGPSLGGVSGSPDRAYHPRPASTPADHRLDSVPFTVWVPEAHCACDLLVRVGRDRWRDRVGGVAAGASDHVSAGGWMVLPARSDAAHNAEITALPLTQERRHRVRVADHARSLDPAGMQVLLHRRALGRQARARLAERWWMAPIRGTLMACTPSGRRRRGPPGTVAPWIASQRGSRPRPLSR